MFAWFDENPAMTLQVIKETKHYGRMDNVKTVYPPQTKFAGGIKNLSKHMLYGSIQTVAVSKYIPPSWGGGGNKVSGQEQTIDSNA